ncbi:glycerate kinase [Vibrio cholerae]
MKVVIAPDSFKESLTAMEVADAIERGCRSVWPDANYIKLPMADGGEGTVQSLVDATGGSIVPVLVTGPMSEPVEAFYGLLGDGRTAVIEMAAASGIHLVAAEDRNPLTTTSYGTGELILAAIAQGVTSIIIGIGGSATNDGGVGMLQALGVRCLDRQGNEIAFGGGALRELERLDLSGLDPALTQVELNVACDVDNPLCGELGASAVFGPQKGATAAMVKQLDDNLAHYADIIERTTGAMVKHQAGAGAAGGLGAALLGVLNAKLTPGIDIVMQALALDSHLQRAELVITGEGRIDSQTIHGKTPIGVAKAAKRYDIPVIGIAGSLAKDCAIVHQHGLDAVFSVVLGATDLPTALKEAAFNVELTARNVAAALAVHLD